MTVCLYAVKSNISKVGTYCAARGVKRITVHVLSSFLSKIEISFEEYLSSIFCKSFTKQVSLLTFDNFSLISTRVADSISFIIGVANKCCQLQLTYLLMRLAFNGT